MFYGKLIFLKSAERLCSAIKKVKPLGLLLRLSSLVAGLMTAMKHKPVFSPGLLVHTQNAGLKAWKYLLHKGSATTSLAKILQDPEEPYSDFISRLNDAVKQLNGKGETESSFLKHLAFKAANPACQVAICPHSLGAEISHSIKLSAGIGYGIGQRSCVKTEHNSREVQTLL